jgi:hypothetical protein
VPAATRPVRSQAIIVLPEPMNVPGQYAPSVRVFLRDRNNRAKLLAEARAEANQAVCLVGRTEKNALKAPMNSRCKQRSPCGL